MKKVKETRYHAIPVEIGAFDRRSAIYVSNSNDYTTPDEDDHRLDLIIKAIAALLENILIILDPA